MPDPQLPPWMGHEPPPVPPRPVPPPPGASAPWPGPPPPPPTPGSGFLVAIGVLNLIFAIACGCTSGIWAKAWTEVQEQPERIAEQLENSRDEMQQMTEQVLGSRSRSSHASDQALKAASELATSPEALKAALTAAADHPSTSSIRTATMVGGLAQAALLVGSIMLLMRKNVGRVFSMLALVAFIGATIATLVKFPPVARDTGGALAAKMEEAPAFQALPAADQQQVRTLASSVPLLGQVMVFAGSIVVMIWPAISLLILLASRGIKDACRPSYGPPSV